MMAQTVSLINLRIMILLIMVLNLSGCDKISAIKTEPGPPMTHKVPSYLVHHPLTLLFEGPYLSETGDENPFADYRLLVEFTHQNRQFIVRGFFAADGNAAESSAEDGAVWKVHFTPMLEGSWEYRARLARGAAIGIDRAWDLGETISIPNSQGQFFVNPSNAVAPDFRAPERGLLTINNGYFRFASSGQYWLKAGANSPENLLGYTDFDGTYRISAQNRDGEAVAGEGLHRFQPHLGGWQAGDPDWQNGKGRALIGAINYLAEKSMNSVYFLTLNILGDGQDVWPFHNPEDFTRFDVSKLDQWNIVFSHMQRKGILLHLVTQETENELLLDDGNMGFERSLYFSELIARFAHHSGLVWNLGEENGPVHWRPEGQNDEQRKAMAVFLKHHDPYGHPILLHTHSEPADKDVILTPLLEESPIDGLSFQVADRETVNAETRKWRIRSRENGRPWLITMDEIGMWHTGALPDSVDPYHDSLVRHVIWGHLLGGGAGVEWYFGANHPHNDLTSEDWRMRDTLWTLSRYAMHFFERYLPFWKMKPCTDEIVEDSIYCFTDKSNNFVVYLPEDETVSIQLPRPHTEYRLHWYNPFQGGELLAGELLSSNDGEIILKAPNRVPFVKVGGSQEMHQGVSKVSASLPPADRIAFIRR